MDMQWFEITFELYSKEGDRYYYRTDTECETYEESICFINKCLDGSGPFPKGVEIKLFSVGYNISKQDSDIVNEYPCTDLIRLDLIRTKNNRPYFWQEKMESNRGFNYPFSTDSQEQFIKFLKSYSKTKEEKNHV